MSNDLLLFKHANLTGATKAFLSFFPFQMCVNWYTLLELSEVMLFPKTTKDPTKFLYQKHISMCMIVNNQIC